MYKYNSEGKFIAFNNFNIGLSAHKNGIENAKYRGNFNVNAFPYNT
jgi:hypothetical protein